MSKEGTFVIFCIENYKLHRSMSGREVYELFERYDVFSYLRTYYDVLHTAGAQYVSEDIDRYLRVRGVT